MRTEELLVSMLAARDRNPQLFTSRKVKAKNKSYTILSRSVEVSMLMDGTAQKGLLIFSDQNPLGKSNDALKVLRGEAQPKDVNWLYFKNQTGAPVWLGNIKTNQKTQETVINVLLDAEYNREKKEISLVIPDKIREQLPI
jgi:hypothetical protein